jgi:hypothetical protein
VTVNVTTNSFPLIQITGARIAIRILVIFRPIHFTKYEHYNRSFVLMVRLRLTRKMNPYNMNQQDALFSINFFQ